MSEITDKALERIEKRESEKAIFLVAKDKDGVVQIISETATTDKQVATTEANKRAMENGSDYLVVKIISRHKKRVSTDVINYE